MIIIYIPKMLILQYCEIIVSSMEVLLFQKGGKCPYSYSQKAIRKTLAKSIKNMILYAEPQDPFQIIDSRYQQDILKRLSTENKQGKRRNDNTFLSIA